MGRKKGRPHFVYSVLDGPAEADVTLQQLKVRQIKSFNLPKLSCVFLDSVSFLSSASIETQRIEFCTENTEPWEHIHFICETQTAETTYYVWLIFKVSNHKQWNSIGRASLTPVQTVEMITETKNYAYVILDILYVVFVSQR